MRSMMRCGRGKFEASENIINRDARRLHLILHYPDTSLRVHAVLMRCGVASDRRVLEIRTFYSASSTVVVGVAARMQLHPFERVCQE